MKKRIMISLGMFGLVLGLLGSAPRTDAKRLPKEEVKYSQISVTNKKMKKNADGSYEFRCKIKNSSKKGTIKKISVTYEITERRMVTSAPDTTAIPQVTPTPDQEVETSPAPDQTVEPVATSTPVVTVAPRISYIYKTKTVVVSAKNIKPGKSSALLSCKGDYTGKVSKMTLKKVVFVAGDAKYTYDAKKKKGVLSWATKDKKPPVFEGWVGKKCQYNGDYLRVCYTDQKLKGSLKDHVKAVDARDGKVKVSVDSSRVNWKKPGVYKVIYTAKDSSGNVAKTYCKVQVCSVGMPELAADQVLSKITKPGWSDVKKLRAIYKYVKSSCSYSSSIGHTNWRNKALKGLRYGTGDCYVFYSMSRLLITRAGIPNIEVTREPATAGHHHWWNLVYVKGGWYHFDATPRARDGYFCLQTDKQMFLYSKGSTFRFNHKKYPKRATKMISKNSTSA